MRFPKALNLWGYAVLQVGLISSMYFLVDYYEKMNLFSWFISLSKLFVAMCYHRGLVASFSICSRLNSPIFANNHTSIIGHFNKAFIAILSLHVTVILVNSKFTSIQYLNTIIVNFWLIIFVGLLWL